MKEVYIVSVARTPIGNLGGVLSSVNVIDLGKTAISAAVERAGVAATSVDEVFMGCVLSANTGQAPARQAALKAGIHENVPCTTVNKVCSSGMKSIMQAAQSIAIGDNDVVIAGGMENMSLIPHYFNARVATKFGSKEVIDGLQLDGLIDVYNKQAMGCLADLCASKYNLSKQDQDDFAVESYSRSKNAWENGKFKNEIIPVEIKDRRGNITIVD